MKKKRERYLHDNGRIHLQIRKMKLTLILTMLVFVTFGNSFSQVKLSLNLKKATIQEVLKTIEDQSDYIFLYRDEIFDQKQHYSIDFDEATFEEVLNSICETAKVDYEIRNERQIILKEKPRHTYLDVADQQKEITGVVTDKLGVPLPGVSIIIKGTSIGTVTGNDGQFSLAIPNNAEILQFSFVGMRMQDLPIEGKTMFTVIMEEAAIGLDEVIAIGYGTIKKSDLTGSVTSVKTEDLENIQMQSIDQALAGRAAGVQVIQSSGVPGSAPAVRVRGTTSLQGANEPLYVVDGFPIYAGGGSGNAGTAAGSSNISGIANINPNDIESIEILKDASATAIYGARAANGVILITTKSGIAGSDKISFSADYGFQSVVKKMDVMDAYQYAVLKNEAYTNEGSAPVYSNFDLEEIKNNPELGTNWQDEVFQVAPTQEYNISFTGGDRKTNYAITGGYTKQDGIIKSTDFERFSSRINLSRQMNSWLKAGTHISAFRIFSNQQNVDGLGVVNGATQFSPILPIYSGKGYSFLPSSSASEYTLVNDGIIINNPVATMNEVVRQTQRNGLLGDMFVELKLTPNLTAKITGGANISNIKDDTYLPSNTNEGQGSKGNGTVEYNLNQNWLNENTLSYINEFGKHSVSAVVGATFQENTYEYVLGSSQGFTNDILQENNLQGAETYNSPQSGKTRWGLISYLARANYSYNGKYLASIAGRMDGSSRFGENNKYAFFPSGSVAWRASEEDFIKDLNLFSYLKLRASFGYTGNQEIGLYNSLPTTGTQTYTFGDGSLATGVSPNKIANPDLQWEKTAQFDVGIDMAFFDNRLGFTMDYYHKKTTEMLYSEQVPFTTGFTTYLNNIGSMQNQGFELEIRGDILQGDFKWNTDFNLSFNRNKVLSLAGVLYKDVGVNQGHLKIDPWSRRLFVGEPIGAFFGWQFDGIIQEGETIDQTISQVGPGRRKYKDVSSEDDNPEDGKYTGEPDGVVDNADRQVIGNALPDFIGGMSNNFSYKNFTLNVFLQWSVGNDILNFDKTQLTLPTGGQNVYADMVNRWTPENPSNEFPLASTNRQIVFNDYYIEDGSYLKIKNIVLGYTFPKNLVKFADRLYVYSSLNNFITFTKYSGFDPEVSLHGASNLTMGEDYSTYPQSKTLMFGVKIDF